MTTYPSYSDAARDAIAATLDLSPAAVTAWLRCEGSGPGRNNPLNGRRGMPGAIGYTPAPGLFAIFPDVLTAARGYLYRLRTTPGVGYEAILASAGKDPRTQALAIQDSDWAAGHYGHSCLVDQLPATPPAPSPRHAAVVVIATALYNAGEGRWVYNGPNRIRAGTRLVVRGAGYTFGGVTCYPVEQIAPDPEIPAGWTGQGYYVPRANVHLLS